MDWPPRCCTGALHRARLASCWGIAIHRPPRSTPRSISRHCVHWLCRGREVCDEHASTGRSRISESAPQFRVQAAGCRQGFARFRRVHGAPPHFLHYQRTGPGLGSTTSRRPTSTLGATTELRARIRPPSLCHRSTNADSSLGLVAISTEESTAVPVLGRLNSKLTARYSRHALSLSTQQTATLDLPRSVRTAECLRPTSRRSAQSRTSGLGS